LSSNSDENLLYLAWDSYVSGDFLLANKLYTNAVENASQSNARHAIDHLKFLHTLVGHSVRYLSWQTYSDPFEQRMKILTRLPKVLNGLNGGSAIEDWNGFRETSLTELLRSLAQSSAGGTRKLAAFLNLTKALELYSQFNDARTVLRSAFDYTNDLNYEDVHVVHDWAQHVKRHCQSLVNSFSPPAQLPPLLLFQIELANELIRWMDNLEEKPQFSSALEWQVEVVESNILLGNILAISGKLDEAEHYFDQALVSMGKIDPIRFRWFAGEPNIISHLNSSMEIGIRVFLLRQHIKIQTFAWQGAHQNLVPFIAELASLVPSENELLNIVKREFSQVALIKREKLVLPDYVRADMDWEARSHEGRLEFDRFIRQRWSGCGEQEINVRVGVRNRRRVFFEAIQQPVTFTKSLTPEKIHELIKVIRMANGQPFIDSLCRLHVSHPNAPWETTFNWTYRPSEN